MKNIALCLLPLLFCFSCSATAKKELNASEIIRLIKTGKPVQIVDKIIMDDLNFTEGSEPFVINAAMLQSEITSNIFFDHCIFIGKVTSNGSEKKFPIMGSFKNNLVFTNCDFRGAVDFSNAIVFGAVNFSKSIFRENANFNNITVWAKNSYFAEIQSETNFSMVYAAFFGNTYFTDAHFNNASFQETSIKGKLSFNNAVFTEKAGFDLMEVSGSAFFNYAQFAKGADFSFSRFLYVTEFVETKFEGKGIFEKTFFLNTVRMDKVNPDNMTFKDTFFGNKTNEN